MPGREILQLYKSLLRESKKFPSYSFREYAIQRIKDAFRENQNIHDELKLKELYNFGLENLEVIKRQVVIGQMYAANPLIIEKKMT